MLAIFYFLSNHLISSGLMNFLKFLLKNILCVCESPIYLQRAETDGIQLKLQNEEELRKVRY